MADLTKAQLCARVLEHLGVKSAQNAANGHDQAFAEEAFDSTYERFRKLGLAPFATSAIPSWAQTPLRDAVAGDCAQSFGQSGQRLLEFKAAAREAEKELRRQTAARRHPIRIAPDYF